jgi:hypothetical protein
MTDTDRAEQRRALEQFANASGQPNQPMPSGHALVRPTASLTPIGAQPVAMYRDEARIFQKLAALAAAAGTDWFYKYPVRNQDGSQGWIEGPSIKLANDVARIFGNCIIEVRELDVGDAFVFYARFSDIETGFSMERAYRQRKTQSSIKSKDQQRQLDIAYQIGQSKAIRNVICNSLQIYSDYAFDRARDSLIDQIGKDLPRWRERTVEGLARIPVELHRVERRVGRAAKDWLASNIAQVIAEMQAIADGMATVDDTWPPDQTITEKAPSSPRLTPAEPPAPGDAAPTSPAAGQHDSATPGEPPAASAAAPKNFAEMSTAAPKNFAEYMQLAEVTCIAALDADALMKWFRSEPQRRLRNACGLVSEETAQVRALVETRVQELNG